jgi:hypothetical protein
MSLFSRLAAALNVLVNQPAAVDAEQSAAIADAGTKLAKIREDLDAIGDPDVQTRADLAEVKAGLEGLTTSLEAAAGITPPAEEPPVEEPEDEPA